MFKKLISMMPEPIKGDPIEIEMAIICFLAMLFVVAVSLAPGGGW